jgi:5,10-methylenetetrahydromethanopterin reductase
VVEFWRSGAGLDSVSPHSAARIEADGWDGQVFMDSQSLGGDPYALMGAWALATHRLRLATGVTNPLTRHPAVTAAAIATVQWLSRGRAVLGIGRGDSALAFLGHAPAPLPVFERSLLMLQRLLNGETTEFGTHATTSAAESIESLSVGGRPAVNRLSWLPQGLPKVPLDVAATGPKLIGMAARIAERISFSVGANPERLAWALDIARAARRAAVPANGGISYGAQIVVVCHPDIDAVRDAAASIVAPLARFQVMLGDAAGPQQAGDAGNFATIRSGYDLREHGKYLSKDKLSGAALSWDFIERFAIVGPPGHCVRRLRELLALGIERFVVLGPGFHPEVRGEGTSLFASEVMPALR